MKFLTPKVLLGAASLALVVMLALRDIADPGPGPLHPVHAAMPELAGRDGCVLCHGDPGTPAAMIQGCLACHEEITEQLEDGRGLHGQLAVAASMESTTKPEAVRCDVCHGEHHGGSIELAGDSAFLRAGFASLGGFDHAGLDFGLEGIHTSLDCVACHTNAEVDVLAEGATRFLGLASTCTDCHEDPHQGAMPATCSDCHGQMQPFASVAAFLHPETFPLTPPHADLSCDQCHDRGALPASTPGALANTDQADPETRDCAECHDSPHSPTFLVDAAVGCAECHGGGALSFREANQGSTSRLHHATGFPLDGAHANVDCASCHQASGEFIERFPQRQASDCAACHDDVHRGAFDQGPAGCVACHSTQSFAWAEPSAFDHGRWTGFALTGAHASAECATCHGEAADESRAFGFVADIHLGDPHQCSTCHESPHGSRFHDQRHPETGKIDCSTCHTERDFLEIKPGSFDHGGATGFALVGAHAQAKCTVCHAPAEEAVTRLGQVSDHFPGNTNRCDTCHRDPHRGAFQGRVGPLNAAAIVANPDCATCHESTSFHVTEPFQHGPWTGWPLENSHADLACSECHPAQAPDVLGRTHGFAAGSACADCHESPHLGQFRSKLEGAPTDASCVRCHTTAGPFNKVLFDHDTARFALDETHADLDCNACHKAATTRQGKSAIRYRPLGHECIDCHGTGTQRRDGSGAKRKELR